MSAREEILGSVRAALAERPETSPAPRAYRRRGALGEAERVALFCERVGDYRADVRRVTAAELEPAIAAVLAGRRVAVPPGLTWRPDGVELVTDDGLSPDELDALEGVLTGCTIAIAETGTIVLAGGATDGRRALTLVPDLHVCVVDEAQIVELVPEAMDVLGELVRRERRPVTFVSGPSATSDIELSRVEGVHGPRTLIVMVVSPQSATTRSSHFVNSA
jgi:L-lactate dehydrogenase complex protein LldG